MVNGVTIYQILLYLDVSLNYLAGRNGNFRIRITTSKISITPTYATAGIQSYRHQFPPTGAQIA